ncbi:MAG: phage tail assembly protein [Alphaproteobacteria bacterium]|nr:phage tail assembly protein [Alphaproteobacteria bacterium]
MSDEEDKNVVKLSKPAEAFGDKITELRFREPKGKDYLACGMPVSSSGGDVHVYMPTLFKLAARLAKVPMKTLEELPGRDVRKVMEMVTGFMADEEDASTSDPSISPGSGTSTLENSSA